MSEVNGGLLHPQKGFDVIAIINNNLLSFKGLREFSLNLNKYELYLTV
jgi:hypothetical protein